MFHKAGDLMNAMFHYKQSVQRHLKYSQRGESSCRELSKKVRQNLLRGVPYPKLRKDQDEDAKTNSTSFASPVREVSMESESSYLVTPCPSSETDISPGPLQQITSSQSYEAAASVTTGTEPGDAFIFDVIDVDQHQSPKQRCAAIMFNMTVIYYLKGMESESMRLLRHLEEVRHECSSDVFAKISNNLGYLYVKTGRYSDAVDFLLSSLLEYWSKVGDNLGGALPARLLFSFAKAQYMLGQFDNSAESYQSAMSFWLQGENLESDCHVACAA